ncbi:hypothetical protein BJ970_002786 [Saccharopolyspora phatthalungensis]|uniref:Uncharacterized protein n=1 Tax=Saccharopolyspora phatthalungensis TaxID=664693 RepID=A0A840PYA0_9PSEU|nr:hypothetical protein [Saccharopolyspora phatthalungensis]
MHGTRAGGRPVCHAASLTRAVLRYTEAALAGREFLAK